MGASSIPLFAGKATAKSKQFINKLTAHFNINKDYYTTDRRKANLAVSRLNPSIMDLWAEFTEKWAIPKRWNEFVEFCLHQVNGPRAMQREAAQKYYDV